MSYKYDGELSHSSDVVEESVVNRDQNEIDGAIEMLRTGRSLADAISMAVRIKECLERDRLINAVEGLRQFSSNWCDETDYTKDRFRCNRCNFSCGEQCLVKVFIHSFDDEDIENVFDKGGE